jgi:hypothetical protein
MSTKNLKQWILATGLVIAVLGIYGYQARIVNNEQEICREQGKEGQEKKAKSTMPMWESLSSHLIMESRN